MKKTHIVEKKPVINHVLNTLAFYAKYTGKSTENPSEIYHHSFNSKCRDTKRAIKSLEKQGFLIVDWETKTAHFTGKTH